VNVRVRFAPSPTGYLHIGGARTCLYNYLFAKSKGGSLILRIEDTDLDRSSRQFELAQRADLEWLGITFDEGPEIGGHVGPYRQSERHKIYEEVALQLIANGHAFYCFCREEVLERKKAAALAQNLNPAYDGTCYGITAEEAQDRMDKGEEAVVRFKTPDNAYTLNDLVRDEVVFPAGMVGDFVLLRSNKMPTYNFCCVVDDIKMKITHVIRGEDHLNNTLRQLMIYDALSATPPQFAHASLLIGKDRQKLSKRHGATSVAQYREEGYLPEALLNYLCLLGWSHPAEKDVFTMSEIIPLFGIERFSKASPIYDMEKLAYINNQHLRLLPIEELASRYGAFTTTHSMFLESSIDWRHRFLNLFKEKAQTFRDFEMYGAQLLSLEIEGGEEVAQILAMPTTKNIAQYLVDVLTPIAATTPFVSEVQVGEWMDAMKNTLGVKGKPLFLGGRLALTAQPHGPDLKILSSLTPTKILLERAKRLLQKLSS